MFLNVCTENNTAITIESIQQQLKFKFHFCKNEDDWTWSEPSKRIEYIPFEKSKVVILFYCRMTSFGELKVGRAKDGNNILLSLFLAFNTSYELPLYSQLLQNAVCRRSR